MAINQDELFARQLEVAWRLGGKESAERLYESMHHPQEVSCANCSVTFKTEQTPKQGNFLMFSESGASMSGFYCRKCIHGRRQ